MMFPPAVLWLIILWHVPVSWKQAQTRTMSPGQKPPLPMLRELRTVSEENTQPHQHTGSVMRLCACGHPCFTSIRHLHLVSSLQYKSFQELTLPQKPLTVLCKLSRAPEKKKQPKEAKTALITCNERFRVTCYEQIASTRGYFARATA